MLNNMSMQQSSSIERKCVTSGKAMESTSKPKKEKIGQTGDRNVKAYKNQVVSIMIENREMEIQPEDDSGENDDTNQEYIEVTPMSVFKNGEKPRSPDNRKQLNGEQNSRQIQEASLLKVGPIDQLSPRLSLSNDEETSQNNKENQQINGKKKYSIRKCNKCCAQVNNLHNALHWQEWDYCNEFCLVARIQAIGNCAFCKKRISSCVLGKYCLRFANWIKQFCSAKCLQKYRIPLAVCNYCQTRITGEPTPLVVEESNNIFFCTRICLQKHKLINQIPNEICVTCKGGRRSDFVAIKYKEDCFCSYQCYRLLNALTNKVPKCHLCTQWILDDNQLDTHTVFYNGTLYRFCREACKNHYIMVTKNKPVFCFWCKTKKSNFDMIRKRSIDGHVIYLCRISCLSMYQASTNLLNSTNMQCNSCKQVKGISCCLTMNDASIRYFCSKSCLKSQHPTQRSPQTGNPANIKARGPQIEEVLSPVKRPYPVNPKLGKSICTKARKALQDISHVNNVVPKKGTTLTKRKPAVGVKRLSEPEILAANNRHGPSDAHHALQAALKKNEEINSPPGSVIGFVGCAIQENVLQSPSEMRRAIPQAKSGTSTECEALTVKMKENQSLIAPMIFQVPSVTSELLPKKIEEFRDPPNSVGQNDHGLNKNYCPQTPTKKPLATSQAESGTLNEREASIAEMLIENQLLKVPIIRQVPLVTSELLPKKIEEIRYPSKDVDPNNHGLNDNCLQTPTKKPMTILQAKGRTLTERGASMTGMLTGTQSFKASMIRQVPSVTSEPLPRNIKEMRHPAKSVGPNDHDPNKNFLQTPIKKPIAKAKGETLIEREASMVEILRENQLLKAPMNRQVPPVTSETSLNKIERIRNFSKGVSPNNHRLNENCLQIPTKKPMTIPEAKGGTLIEREASIAEMLTENQLLKAPMIRQVQSIISELLLKKIEEIQYLPKGVGSNKHGLIKNCLQIPTMKPMTIPEAKGRTLIEREAFIAEMLTANQLLKAPMNRQIPPAILDTSLNKIENIRNPLKYVGPNNHGLNESCLQTPTEKLMTTSKAKGGTLIEREASMAEMLTENQLLKAPMDRQVPFIISELLLKKIEEIRYLPKGVGSNNHGLNKNCLQIPTKKPMKIPGAKGRTLIEREASIAEMLTANQLLKAPMSRQAPPVTSQTSLNKIERIGNPPKGVTPNNHGLNENCLQIPTKKPMTIPEAKGGTLIEREASIAEMLTENQLLKAPMIRQVQSIISELLLKKIEEIQYLPKGVGSNNHGLIKNCLQIPTKKLMTIPEAKGGTLIEREASIAEMLTENQLLQAPMIRQAPSIISELLLKKIAEIRYLPKGVGFNNHGLNKNCSQTPTKRPEEILKAKGEPNRGSPVVEVMVRNNQKVPSARRTLKCHSTKIGELRFSYESVVPVELEIKENFLKASSKRRRAMPESEGRTATKRKLKGNVPETPCKKQTTKSQTKSQPPMNGIRLAENQSIVTNSCEVPPVGCTLQLPLKKIEVNPESVDPAALEINESTLGTPVKKQVAILRTKHRTPAKRKAITMVGKASESGNSVECELIESSAQGIPSKMRRTAIPQTPSVEDAENVVSRQSTPSITYSILRSVQYERQTRSRHNFFIFDPDKGGWLLVRTIQQMLPVTQAISEPRPNLEEKSKIIEVVENSIAHEKGSTGLQDLSNAGTSRNFTELSETSSTSISNNATQPNFSELAHNQPPWQAS